MKTKGEQLKTKQQEIETSVKTGEKKRENELTSQRLREIQLYSKIEENLIKSVESDDNITTELNMTKNQILDILKHDVTTAKERESNMTKASNAKLLIVNKDIDNEKKKLDKERKRITLLVASAKRSREELAAARREIDVTIEQVSIATKISIKAIRAETDLGLELLEAEVARQSVALKVEIEAVKTRVLSLETAKRTGEIVYSLTGSCPGGSIEIKGQEIDQYDDLLRLTQNFTLPDLRGRFIRNSSESRLVLTEQGDATATNGLRLTSGGAHLHHHYQSYGIHEGSSLAGVARFNEVSKKTYYAGNHTHSIYGDAETRPANTALTMCIFY